MELGPFSLPEDPTHPAQVAVRTYALALLLALGPAAVSTLLSSKSKKAAFLRTVKKELGPRGFPFAMTLAVGGGGFLAEWSSRKGKSVWPSSVSATRRTLVCNAASAAAAVLLLRTKSRPNQPSRTLDITLLLLVRALDAAVQSSVGPAVAHHKNVASFANAKLLRETLEKEKANAHTRERGAQLTGRIDAFVFSACAARIMWCFFYEPFRLPASYVKWIARLANLDERVIETLKALRRGDWSYKTGSASHSHLLTTLATDLKLPSTWGDPALLPAYGAKANVAWKQLGVKNRSGVAGMPCDIVHCGLGEGLGLGAGCTTNASLRWVIAFLESVLIYLPAHILPTLLTRPQTLLDPARLVALAFSVTRSASFLATFLASCWYGVCLTRTLVLARLFPMVSHDFWDGPWGCVMAGSLLCGSSIWIEETKRRGEMALYVLPKALRASLPEGWLRSGKNRVLWVERLVFVASLASLLSRGVHQPESLRGLSRWTLSFILKGPNAGFWRRKRDGVENSLETTVAPTVAPSPKPAPTDS